MRSTLSRLLSKALGILHEDLVSNRRVGVLAGWFDHLLPQNACVLDTGCGNGLVSATLQRLRPDISVRGVDVLPRDHAAIPVQIFDGSRIPFADGSFDVVLLSDVLHH